jgi:glycosyltransferase involved in cell wall biosynthesis
MRILQINNCHYRRGGADVVYLNTIDLLRKNGQTVIEFSQTNQFNKESEYLKYFVNGIDFLNAGFLSKVYLTPKLLYNPESSKQLEKLIQIEKPEVAHIHLYKGGLTVSILKILKKFHIPVCITLHDFGLLCPRNLFFDGNNQICEKCLTIGPIGCLVNRCNRKNFFYSMVTYLEFIMNNQIFESVNFFDKLISVSKFNLDKHVSNGMLNNKFTQIYNFFPDCEITKPKNTRGKYFLYYGRISNEKGLVTLISTFKQTSNLHNLKIVGTGSQLENLKKLTLNNTNIEFLGFKSGTELTDLISGCSFVIVPSECYENNPMSIVESFSLGKPVIGSKIGGIPELIQENENGYLFEMKNEKQLLEKIQIASTLSDDSYFEMSKKAREFALENFSETKHYKKLIELYKTILKNRNE